MTNPTAWAHLPNAKHIDRIIADVKARPDVWAATWDAALDAAWNAALDNAWHAARDAALGAARGAAWVAAWDATWVAAWDATWHAARIAVWDAALDTARIAAWHAARDAARDAAWCAIYALIAWDEAATLLTLTPDALRILMHTAPEPMNHQAVLLLPAVIALNGESHDNV